LARRAYCFGDFATATEKCSISAAQTFSKYYQCIFENYTQVKMDSLQQLFIYSCSVSHKRAHGNSHLSLYSTGPNLQSQELTFYRRVISLFCSRILCTNEQCRRPIITCQNIDFQSSTEEPRQDTYDTWDTTRKTPKQQFMPAWIIRTLGKRFGLVANTVIGQNGTMSSIFLFCIYNL